MEGGGGRARGEGVGPVHVCKCVGACKCLYTCVCMICACLFQVCR